MDVKHFIVSTILIFASQLRLYYSLLMHMFQFT